jgi:hypothetical protein
VISGVQSCYYRSTLPWAILGSSEITQVYMIGQLSPEIPFRLRKGPPGSPLLPPHPGGRTVDRSGCEAQRVIRNSIYIDSSPSSRPGDISRVAPEAGPCSHARTHLEVSPALPAFSIIVTWAALLASRAPGSGWVAFIQLALTV